MGRHLLSHRVSPSHPHPHIRPYSHPLHRSIIIMIMGLTMLKLDQAKTKWRVKLQHAFAKNHVRDRSAKVRPPPPPLHAI